MASSNFDSEIQDAMQPKSRAMPSSSRKQVPTKPAGNRPPPHAAAAHNPRAVASPPPPPQQNTMNSNAPMMLTGAQSPDPDAMGDLARAHATIVNHMASRMR